MKNTLIAVLTSCLGVTEAFAAPTQVSFVGTITFAAPNTPYAAIGPTVFGSYVFDYDSATYTIASNPGEGTNWGGYEYIGAAYGLTANLPQLSTLTPTGNLGLGVYDNGSLVQATGITSDSIFFGAKRNAISYALGFTGPNNTFTTNSLPSTSTITSPWTTRVFIVRDASFDIVLQAAVTQVQVSLVPEASTTTYTLLGASALFALFHLRRRR